MAPLAGFFGSGELPPVEILLQPVTDQHLYNADGTPSAMLYVRLFSIIACLILVIACINYVNLVTARTGKRSKEMGVRRFLGAKRGIIIRLSLRETCIMLALSIIGATLLIYMALPFYNQVSSKDMEFSVLSFRTLIIYGITFFSVLGLAGLYPSFYLASFNTSKFTKNRTYLIAKVIGCRTVCMFHRSDRIHARHHLTNEPDPEKRLGIRQGKRDMFCFMAHGK